MQNILEFVLWKKKIFPRPDDKEMNLVLPNLNIGEKKN